MSRKSKLFRKAHFLLLLLICFTLAAGIYILNAPQKAGTIVARKNFSSCANTADNKNYLGYSTTDTSQSCTLGFTPTIGRTLIAVISGNEKTANSNIVTNGVWSGDCDATVGKKIWTKAVENTSASTGNINISIWYINNLDGLSTSMCVDWSAASRGAAIISEYAGILTSTPLDKTAVAISTASGTTVSTGTTTKTSQASQIWVAGLSTANNTSTFSNYGTFTEVTTQATSGGGASQVKLAFAEKEASVSEAASATATVNNSAAWAGAIATFNYVTPPTQIAFSTSPPTLTAGTCSSAITFETRDSGGIASPASNDVQIQVTTNSFDGVAIYFTDTCLGSQQSGVFSFNGSESSKTFYVKALRAGSFQLTAAKITGSDTLTDGTLSYTVNAGTMTRLGIQMPGQTSAFYNGLALGTPDNQTAGVSFTITQIKALDDYDNEITSYTGTKTISFGGASNAPNGTAPNYTTNINFTNGVSTTILTTILYSAETGVILTATEGGLYGAPTPQFDVSAGALDNYGVVTTNTTLTAGNCSTTGNSITAYDQFGNTRSTDTSTVNMTTTMLNTTFYTSAACTTTTTQYTLSSGVANFYFKATKKATSSFTSMTMPASNNWRSITYGNGKFVSVASNTTGASYSTDGINWSSSTLPSSVYWTTVVYGGDKFVAVASGTTLSAYSTDGINWSTSNLPSTASWDMVVYGNGVYMAVAPGMSSIAYSTDGITWSSKTLPTTSFWRTAIYASGKFIILSSNSTTALYSTDAINWSSTTMPYGVEWYSIAYGGGKFVAISGGMNAYSLAAYSTDGISWTGSSMPSSSKWRSVVYGNGKFMAIAGGGVNINAYSTNGINWTGATDLPTSNDWNSLAYGNGKYVAVSLASSSGAYLMETTISATKSGDTPTGTTSSAITVSPAAVSTILTKLPGQSFTDGTGITGSASFTGLRTPNATAGTSFTVTLHAVDSYNNLVDSGGNNYTGSKTISWVNSTAGNAPGGTVPSYPTSSVTFSNGASSTTLTATYYNATTSRNIRADDTGSSINGTASTAFSVQANTTDNYNVSASSPQLAGIAFNVTITARDVYNNALGSLYSAPVGSYSWTTSAGNAPDSTSPSIGALAQNNFTNGVATKSVTLYKAEAVTFTASEPSPSSVTGTTSSITVSPGSLSSASTDSTITGNASGYRTYAETITLTLKDTWRNPIPNFNKSNISVSATGSPSVTQLISDTDANGQTTTVMTWNTVGTYTISASISNATLVQNDGITVDGDGTLDSTHTISITNYGATPSSTIQGGSRIRGGTRIQ